MKRLLIGIAFTALLSAQTAEELVSKNLQAKGGLEKLKAIHSLRLTGRMQQGGLSAQLGRDTVAPDLLRQASRTGAERKENDRRRLT